MTGRTRDNPWQILGIEPTCTFEEARAAYKIQLQLNHPDRHSGSSREVVSAAAHETRQINEAWLNVKSHYAQAAEYSSDSAVFHQHSPVSLETLLGKIEMAQAALGAMPSLATRAEPTAVSVQATIDYDLRRRWLTQLQLELASMLSGAARTEMDRAVWAKTVDAWRNALEINQITLNKHLKLRSILVGESFQCGSCQSTNTVKGQSPKAACGQCGTLFYRCDCGEFSQVGQQQLGNRKWTCPQCGLTNHAP
jgi:hypothetical protein